MLIPSKLTGSIPAPAFPSGAYIGGVERLTSAPIPAVYVKALSVSSVLCEIGGSHEEAIRKSPRALRGGEPSRYMAISCVAQW